MISMQQNNKVASSQMQYGPFETLAACQQMRDYYKLDQTRAYLTASSISANCWPLSVPATVASQQTINTMKSGNVDKLLGPGYLLRKK